MQAYDESGRARFSTLAKTIARPSAGASQKVPTGLEQYRLPLCAEFIPHLSAGGQNTITTSRAMRTPGVVHMHTHVSRPARQAPGQRGLPHGTEAVPVTLTYPFTYPPLISSRLWSPSRSDREYPSTWLVAVRTAWCPRIQPRSQCDRGRSPAHVECRCLIRCCPRH